MTASLPPGDIGDVLITEAELAERVAELGAQITTDYAGKSPLVVGVLNGSVFFVADLVRRIDLPITMDFLSVSSYGGTTKSSGVLKIVKDLDQSVAGRDVLIVEDIVDSGLTLKRLLEHIEGRGATSVKSCALLLRTDEDNEGRSATRVDYLGFKISGAAFVLGYGLDVAQHYRHVPYIAEFKSE